MPRLIRRGSKTKITTDLDGEQSVSRLTALNNGEDLGEFPTDAEAQSHAETLLERDPAGCYIVCRDDGTLSEWVYDIDEQNRQDAKHDRAITVATACILALISGAAIASCGVSPFSRRGLAYCGVSVGIYLFARTFGNLIESVVAWVIGFTLLITALNR